MDVIFNYDLKLSKNKNIFQKYYQVLFEELYIKTVKLINIVLMRSV